VHLEHARSYRTPEMKQNCRAIRAETQRRRATWTTHGIDRHRHEPIFAFEMSPLASESVAPFTLADRATERVDASA
jgi:hypothetical protein